MLRVSSPLLHAVETILSDTVMSPPSSQMSTTCATLLTIVQDNWTSRASAEHLSAVLCFAGGGAAGGSGAPLRHQRIAQQPQIPMRRRLRALWPALRPKKLLGCRSKRRHRRVGRPAQKRQHLRHRLLHRLVPLLLRRRLRCGGSSGIVCRLRTGCSWIWCCWRHTVGAVAAARKHLLPRLRRRGRRR